MFTNSKLTKSIRLAIAVGAVSTTAFINTAIAQEEPLAAVEKISVTGSRIKSADLSSASPLQIIDSTEIDQSGLLNIQDLLLANPAFGTPAISRSNSNFSTSSAGTAIVDLRNLGSARTLVLINGRRAVAGVPGSSAVDLNNIPTQFIDRVEILTGGASSVYGSDAVAGVVNIVLKKDFEGVEFEAQYGETAEGDNEETQLNFTTGLTSSDGKGNIMFHIGYTDQGAVYSKDRDRSAIDQLDTFWYFTGEPKDYGTAALPYYSSYAPQGHFYSSTKDWTYAANGTLQDFWSTNGSDTTPANGFNRSEHRTISVPLERRLFAAKGNYELSDEHSVFFEATYASTQATTQLEPFPFDSTSIYHDGVVPVEFNVNGDLLVNPYVPAAMLADMVDVNGDGLRDLEFFSKRLLDVGNRGNTANRDNFRFVLGFEGEIGADWYYDVYYNYGVTKESQVGGGQVNVLNFRNALEAVTDSQDLDGDGLTDDAVCVDATARAQGCVPINIYGFNSITADAANYIAAPTLLITNTEQEIVGGNVSGEIFDLPAGPLGVAIGFEHRKEYSSSAFDPLAQAGLNAGNAIPATEGEFDVTEFYIESNVPILESLNLRTAIRTSDYSTVGNTLSWNVGFEWAPFDDVRFRAIRAQSTRAPNIEELYSPPSQTFPSGLLDPCLGATASSGSAACLADPGVAANIAANGIFTQTQSDIQGISGYNLGNPNVEEEKGKSTTIGVVWSPSEGIFENLAVTLDYFDIEIEDAIVSTPRQFILDQCYGGGDSSFCDFIIRRPSDVGNNSAGSLEFIDSGVSNSGGLATEGVDLVVSYNTEIGTGTLTTRLAYTYLIDGYNIPLPGSDKDYFAGEIGAAEHKAFLTVGYTWEDFSIAVNTTYIGKSYEDDQALASYDLGPHDISVGAEVLTDMQLSYNYSEVLEIYGGVNNVFDNEPPRILSGSIFSNTGTETDAGTYDVFGRSYYLGLRAKF